MSDLKKEYVACAVIAAAAIGLILSFGLTWYSWEIVETQGSGDVPAWNAWPGEDLNHATVVAVLGAITAVTAIVGILGRRRSMVIGSAITAGLTVAGVGWLIADPYNIPIDAPGATFSLTLEPATWLGLGAALVLFVVTTWAAIDRPVPTPRHRRAALVSMVVFGALLLAASAVAHVQTTGRYPQPDGFAQASGPYPGTITCGMAEAWVSEGQYNRGKMESDTWSLTSVGVYPPRCNAPNGKPAGTINTRAVYQVRINGIYQGCDASNLQYNNSGAYKVQFERNYLKHPCGSNHYYRTQGYHGYKRQAGWVNQSRSSPAHFFG